MAKMTDYTFVSELNLDRMVRSATAGAAGEPYCSLIVECLWQTKTWLNMTLRDIESFWDDAALSDLTVREFIDAKRHEFA
jgi:hypothetical protein